jgi:hypothetical protein
VGSGGAVGEPDGVGEAGAVAVRAGAPPGVAVVAGGRAVAVAVANGVAKVITGVRVAVAPVETWAPAGAAGHTAGSVHSTAAPRAAALTDQWPRGSEPVLARGPAAVAFW